MCLVFVVLLFTVAPLLSCPLSLLLVSYSRQKDDAVVEESQEEVDVVCVSIVRVELAMVMSRW